jgi:hypothetical protein
LVQETRDDDVDVVDLPSNCTKLGLYKALLAERGWKYIYNPKGRVTDKIPIEGMKQEPDDPSFLPSMTSFLHYWENHYPKMKIQKHAADICDECFVFANQVRYRQCFTGKEGRSTLLDDAADDLIEGAVKENEANGLDSEEIILAAAAHVDKQKKQRDMFNLLKKQARNYLLKANTLQV